MKHKSLGYGTILERDLLNDTQILQLINWEEFLHFPSAGDLVDAGWPID